ncbi:hypothetical protein [Streptomyces sp. NPDC046862]
MRFTRKRTRHFAAFPVDAVDTTAAAQALTGAPGAILAAVPGS